MADLVRILLMSVPVVAMFCDQALQILLVALPALPLSAKIYTPSTFRILQSQAVGDRL